MLTELHLRNFRCFEKHKLPMGQTTIIVGQNNAGKSTIVEALRMVSIVVNRYKYLTFTGAPGWTGLSYIYRGVSPSLGGMEINFDTIFHGYNDDSPAEIKAIFETGAVVTIYLGSDSKKIFGVIKDSSGKMITDKSQALQTNIPLVSILPQIGPISRKEKIRNPDYLRRRVSSHLASSHFRNHLNLFYEEYFSDFKKLVEETWPGLAILELVGIGKWEKIMLKEGLETQLELLIRDKDFVAEAGFMGHGLQMWLQTMWFLVQSRDDATIILDEPDVYLHADLQRKLIRLLKTRDQQTIIATHSIEIMSEVEADQVLVIDRNKEESTFTTSLPAVQNIIDIIGGVHNIQLARLWSSRRLLLVEGKDVKLLKPFHDIIFPKSETSFDVIPHMSIGGWGGWNYAVGSSMLLKNSGGEKIVTYCILDRDYHTPAELQRKTIDARKRNVQLHIWKKKEIENYLLVAEVIQRLISKNINTAKEPPPVDEIVKKLDSIADNLRIDSQDSLLDSYYKEIGHGKTRKANRKARDKINTAYKTRGGKLSIISGKKAISQLSEWSQKEFDVFITSTKLLLEMQKKEIDPEVVGVLEAIEKKRNFRG